MGAYGALIASLSRHGNFFGFVSLINGFTKPSNFGFVEEMSAAFGDDYE